MIPQVDVVGDAGELPKSSDAVGRLARDRPPVDGDERLGARGRNPTALWGPDGVFGACLRTHFMLQKPCFRLRTGQDGDSRSGLSGPSAKAQQKRSDGPRRTAGGSRCRTGGAVGSFRGRPDESEVDRLINGPLERRPGCMAAFDPLTDRATAPTVNEVAPVTPEIVRLTTHRDRCCGCGQRSASSHPLQVSTARGAASTQLGPRTVDMQPRSRRGEVSALRECRWHRLSDDQDHARMVALFGDAQSDPVLKPGAYRGDAPH